MRDIFTVDRRTLDVASLLTITMVFCEPFKVKKEGQEKKKTQNIISKMNEFN
jgi:hypothetical protein